MDDIASRVGGTWNRFALYNEYRQGRTALGYFYGAPGGRALPPKIQKAICGQNFRDCSALFFQCRAEASEALDAFLDNLVARRIAEAKIAFGSECAAGHGGDLFLFQ